MLARECRRRSFVAQRAREPADKKGPPHNQCLGPLFQTKRPLSASLTPHTAVCRSALSLCLPAPLTVHSHLDFHSSLAPLAKAFSQQFCFIFPCLNTYATFWATIPLQTAPAAYEALWQTFQRVTLQNEQSRHLFVCVSFSLSLTLACVPITQSWNNKQQTDALECWLGFASLLLWQTNRVHWRETETVVCVCV